MKKITLVITLAIVVAFTGLAFAGIGLPKTKSATANKVMDTAKNKGIEQAINDKIKKHKCAFKDAKTEVDTTCDLDKVIDELVDFKNGLETTLVDDFDIHVTASAEDSSLAYKRSNNIWSKLRPKVNWWDHYVNSDTTSPTGLRIWVSVR